MQWLINIIKESLKLEMGYFNRGDPAFFDFRVDDFVKDGAWHVLTLPDFVPINARLVHCFVRIDAMVINKSILFCSGDSINYYNCFGSTIQVVDIRKGTDFSVAMAPGTRNIKYLASVVTWSRIDFIIRGWWL